MTHLPFSPSSSPGFPPPRLSPAAQKRLARTLDVDNIPQERLRALARVLTDEEVGPVAVAVTWLPTDVELAIVAFDQSDPVEQLASVEAPHGCDAIGVVTSGTATSLSKDDEIEDRVQVAVLVDRAGHTASAVRTLDGGLLCHGIVDLCEGRVPDACRRVLGLATAAPPVEPFTLLALQWADAVAALGATTPGSVTWADVLAVRPFDARSTWTELRLGVASGVLQLPGITSDLAAFMDDGMFAREAVACSPSPRALFEVLSATVDRDVLEVLVDHLDDIADQLDLR